jgi:gamma-glutamylcyclotransferase (GGCT)/AIG2-like uncharacterized protein YtfP
VRRSNNFDDPHSRKNDEKQQMNTQYPVFVYGTLRRGESNYHLLKDRTALELPATISGMVLYGLRGFPMMMEVDSAGGKVYGELMTIDPAIYNAVMVALDQLEDYDPVTDSGMYFRVKRDVQLDDGRSVTAWTYLGNPIYLSTVPHDMIAHGDWCRYRQEQTNA